MTEEALALWRKKLVHLLEAEVFEDDAARRFRLGHQIVEVRAKIAELEGEVGPSPTRATPQVDVSRLLSSTPPRISLVEKTT